MTFIDPTFGLNRCEESFLFTGSIWVLLTYERCAVPILSFLQILKNHLLLFRMPQQHSESGFDTYEQLPPFRAKRLESVLGLQDGSEDKVD